jgi:DNA-binding transcriptional MerR regulator
MMFGGEMMKISEVSQQCEISADTLRYYERIGLLPPVNRTESGIRDYSELDVRRVEFIKCMRTAGLPVEMLIEYYRLVQQGDESMGERKAILVERRAEIKARMDELQKTLDLLDYKISYYEKAVLKAESAILE